MGEPIWRPSAERIAASNLTRFAAFAHDEYGAPADDYAALWRLSVEQRERFWTAMMDFGGVLHTPGTAPVLQHRDRMPGAVWFEDTRLNFAENLLARDDEQPALVFSNERGPRRELSYRELHAEVGRVAAGLRELGIGPGDRVAGFLPNLPEAVIAMLATTSLGAAWTSCSPYFGINGVLDRFGRLGNQKEAIDVFQSFRKQYKGSPLLSYTQHLLGEILLIRGDIPLSIGELDGAFNASQGNLWWGISALALYWSYIHQGNLEEANKVSQKLQKRDPL